MTVSIPRRVGDIDPLTKPCRLCGALAGEPCFRMVGSLDATGLATYYGKREGPPKDTPHRGRRL